MFMLLQYSTSTDVVYLIGLLRNFEFDFLNTYLRIVDDEGL